MKNLKNRLKNEAFEHCPDKLDDINREAVSLGLLTEESVDLYEVDSGAGIKAKKVGLTKSLITSVCAFLLIIALFLVIFIPFHKRKGAGSTNIQLTQSEFFGLGAVTTARLLSVEKLNAKALSKKEDALNGIKNNAENLNKYILSFKEFLGDETATSSISNNGDAQYGQYLLKMVINTCAQSSYVLYYNETLIEDKKSDDEREIKYSIDGVMALDGKDYFVHGERNVEEEDGEKEEELKIKAYLDAASGNYVEMKQEISVEDGEREVEYVYGVYANKKLIEETAVEFETEKSGNKNKNKCKILFRGGSEKFEYKLKQTTPEQTEVSFFTNGESGNFTVNLRRNEFGDEYYEYIFADGSTLVI